MDQYLVDLPHQGSSAVDADTVGGPSLLTETKFMQQYRIAAAAHGGGDVAAVRNGLGQVQVFTIGNDGAVDSQLINH